MNHSNISYKHVEELNIYTRINYTIETSNLKICCWIKISISKYAISDGLAKTSRTKEKLFVGLMSTWHRKWCSGNPMISE